LFCRVRILESCDGDVQLTVNDEEVAVLRTGFMRCDRCCCCVGVGFDGCVCSGSGVMLFSAARQSPCL
jgi:hypothetical protein